MEEINIIKHAAHENVSVVDKLIFKKHNQHTISKVISQNKNLFAIKYTKIIPII